MLKGIICAGALALAGATAAHAQERARNEPRAPVPTLAPLADSGPALALTRQQAIDLALANNPQLHAAREQVSQARARVTEAKALPDLAASATIVGQSGPFRPSTAGEHDYALGLTVPFPDRIRLRGQVATADVRSSELSYEQLRQQIASETSQAYSALLVALRHHDDFQQATQLAQDFLARTQARYEGGTSPKLDVVKARVDLAQSRNQLIAAERDVANARAALNRLIARPLGAPIAAADTLGVPPALPALDTLERLALAHRPELRSLDAQRAGARAATTLAKEYWLPDIALGVTRVTIPGAPATYDTDIGISVPLFFWQHRGGEVAESQHRERELAATARDLVAQVSQEVRTAYAAASTAIEQVHYIRDELLPEAQQAYHIATVSYGLGGASTLEVLDAKRALLDAQTQYTDALGAANDAVAQLRLAVGAPLDTTSTGGPHD
ncbi:MAG: TolC family protein [Gemmatimonadaceae bacterium]|nr:TolC family protein [Gemmatimonadaceae bacterium]